MFVFSFACCSVPTLRGGEGGEVGNRYRRLTDASIVIGRSSERGAAAGGQDTFLWMANR